MRAAAAVFAAATMLGGCAINPATGRLQFNLVSAVEEAELGKDLDADVRGAVGLYPDAELRRYVAGVGERVAGHSERQDVRWTFRVLDDEAVNAFALPGGYVYTTRGLLAHLQTEAELAAALAHEVGHVAARHGTNQYSRAQVAARGVGIFRVVDPSMRHVGAIAAGTAQLRLLRYSRDHELEADALGLRYMGAAGYPRGALIDLLNLLGSLAAGQERAPAWLSTHPEPEVRVDRLERGGTAGLGAAPDESYLGRVDGLAFGPDPRDGYITGDRYINPRAGFGVTFPAGWDKGMEDGALLVSAEDQAVMLVVGVSGHETPRQASEAFFGSGGLTPGETEAITAGDFEALSTPFLIVESQTRITGVASFIDADGVVVLYVAFGAEEAWQTHASVVAKSFASIARPSPLERNVAPARIRIAKAATNTTLRAMVETEDETLVPTLARLNRVGPDDPLAAGRPLKLLVGEPARR